MSRYELCFSTSTGEYQVGNNYRFPHKDRKENCSGTPHIVEVKIFRTSTQIKIECDLCGFKKTISKGK